MGDRKDHGAVDAVVVLVDHLAVESNAVVERGLFTNQEDGLVVERVEVVRFLRFGLQVSGAGDLDGDGYTDALVSARSAGGRRACTG